MTSDLLRGWRDEGISNEGGSHWRIVDNVVGEGGDDVGADHAIRVWAGVGAALLLVVCFAVIYDGTGPPPPGSSEVVVGTLTRPLASVAACSKFSISAVRFCLSSHSE